MELINLVKSVLIFLFQMTLLGWLTFLLKSQTVILIVLLFWIYFFVLILVCVLQWLSLHWEILIMLLITMVLLMWKWMGLFLRKNNLLRCWGWPSLLNWIGVLTLSLLLKLPPRKLEPWFVLWSFFLLRLPCISINLPYAHGMLEYMEWMYGILLSHLVWCA